MANKRKKTTRRKPATRRRRKSVGGFGGKIENRQVSIKLMDVLWLAAGGVLNYVAVNPLINKLAKKLVKDDAEKSPMLGEHQAKILSGIKGGGAAFAAYYFKTLPKEVRLALMGVTAASGIEIAGQVLEPKYMKSINGTGDLFSNVGQTPMIEIPVNDSVQLLDKPGNKGLNLANDTALYGMDVALYGTGDLFSNDF